MTPFMSPLLTALQGLPIALPVEAASSPQLAWFLADVRPDVPMTDCVMRGAS